MKISIVNGNPGGMANGLDDYLERLAEVATASGHKVRLFALRDMDIRYCTGCIKCWVQNPGECVMKDDTPTLHRAFVHSDVWLCATPIVMGHVSSLLKKSHDRVLPLLLPYFKVYDGELHHPLRYDRSPDLAVVVDRNGADEEDIQLVERSYRRFSLNMHSRLRYFATMDRRVEEAVDALAAD